MTFLVGRNQSDAHVESFSGNGSTTAFTLSNSTTTNSLVCRINGVVQRNGTDFTVSATTLTFSTAPAAGTNNIVAQYFGVGTLQVPTDASVTNAKMADDAIGIAELSATGTASSSTFLRGDNAWATPASSTLGSPTATTSGTTIDISIPSGTKAIWVSYDGVSPASGDEICLRLGDSGGVETSSYISYLGSYRAGPATSMDSATNMWKLVEQANASAIWYGTVQLFLQNSSTNNWVFSSCLNTLAGTTQTNVSGGQKSLSGELTTLQLLTEGGSAYDAGAVNVVYM